MARPDEREFRRLPVLASSQVELETCTFCPKLCRSVCPVSNAEPSETLTPWGKMSSVYHLARGDVDADKGFAKVAYACTGCHGCSTFCDHGNPVADTLAKARDAVREAGLVPESAKRVIDGFAEHARKTSERAVALGGVAAGRKTARAAVVVGCGYLTNAESEARAAHAAMRALAGRDVDLVGGCCGLPLLHAGDEAGFTRELGKLVSSLEGYDEVFAVDAGCARALRVEAPRRALGPGKIELLVERAAKELHALEPLDDPRFADVRYHDPCQLGRGLGVYEAPRAVLTRLCGKPPAELAKNRGEGACSGAGGLLPVTYPETAKEAAKARVREHTSLGGGTLVTACASSLRAFRRAGEDAHDVVTLVELGTRARARRGERG